MAKKGGSSGEIEPNPLITELLERNAETAKMLKGYVGPSQDEGYIRLYPVLGNLQRTIDVARSDILHFINSPRSGLGAIIVWVKRDAEIVVSRVESSDNPTTGRARFVGVNKGRLRMRVRTQWRNAVYASSCDTCTSQCNTCTSQCTYHCDSDCEVPV
ncbi:hypothetical protein CO661_29655 [Sinorhizobium fredii]|uniref:Uncharacterized protein n=1 Tax=Rhizobium fredii TaxID=380 RepID=A0A2A6LPX7_RHIFR|nr:hypothetical protein CO661_29655 [Sinorhizobium fredii]